MNKKYFEPLIKASGCSLNTMLKLNETKSCSKLQIIKMLDSINGLWCVNSLIQWIIRGYFCINLDFLIAEYQFSLINLLQLAEFSYQKLNLKITRMSSSFRLVNILVKLDLLCFYPNYYMSHEHWFEIQFHQQINESWIFPIANELRICPFSVKIRRF